MDLKGKIIGIVALLVLLIVSVVFFTQAPPPAQTPPLTQTYPTNSCAHAEPKVIDFSPGEQKLLCEGQTAKLGDFELALIEADEVPILVKIVKEGINEIHALPDEGLLINFLWVQSKPGPESGLMLTIEDPKINVELDTNGEFTVSNFKPVLLRNNIVFMVLSENKTKDVAIVWTEDEGPSDTILSTGWSFDLSGFGISGELVYLGKTDTDYKFKLEEGSA